MSQVEEPAKKLTIHDRVEEFSRLTYEQAEAKKVLVRNLKGLIHKVVRIERANSPLGEHGPGHGRIQKGRRYAVGLQGSQRLQLCRAGRLPDSRRHGQGLPYRGATERWLGLPDRRSTERSL